MAVGLDGFAQRPQDVLPFIQRRRSGQVFSDGFSGYRHAATVDHAVFQQELHDRRHAAHLVQVLHHVTAAGFEVRQVRGAVADRLEVVDIQRHVNGTGHGDQVQHRVGGTAEHGDEDHGVLEGGAGHDVARLQVQFQQVFDGRAGAGALVQLARVHRRRRGTVGQRHAQRFNRRGHGVGRVHAAAGARTRTRRAHDGAAVLFVNPPGDEFPVALERGDDVHFLTLVIAGLDGAAVDHERGAVETAHGHDAAGHVLVAARDGDIGVIPLRAHDGFDGIRDEVPGLQGKTHPFRAHADGVADADCVKTHSHQVPGIHALLDLCRKVQQVHIAGVALEPDAGNPHLGFGHVLFRHAGAVQHGL